MKSLLYTLLILLILSSAVQAQRIPAEKPTLIVGITVSGMRYDYLSAFWEKYGDDGFKRLVYMGANCKNARYDQLITESAVGYATIGTGARPDAHGIVADYWFDRVEEQIVFSIEDPRYRSVSGSDENGHTSPSMMMSRTLSDEIRITSQFQSKVFGIGMDPIASVLQSGHTSNAAYWFDPVRGAWTTSTYYLDSLPEYVNEFNTKNYKDIYREKTWNTLFPLEEYTESLPDSNVFEQGFNGNYMFPYDLTRMGGKKKKNDYSSLLYTPFGNTYTMDFAINTIVSEDLGLRDVTDWINISFNAGKYLSKHFTTWSVEVEDLYIRLDQDLAHLIDFLDDHVGLENTLIYLTADNAIADDPRFLKEHRIPSGYFNYISSISLLKSYLNAVYGQGNWVTFYYANQIYLNHKLIEDSRLSLDEVQDRVANFMIQFSGISNALPAHILQRNNFTEGIFKRIQNSYNQKRSGDVIIYLTPGWIEKGSRFRESLSDFHYDAHVPLLFYGWKINRITLPEDLSPLDIAPTIAYFLEISVPENASGKVITGLIR